MPTEGTASRRMTGFIACFMLLWTTVAWGMAITAYQSGAPFLFTIVPGGMGFLGLYLFINILRGWGESSSEYLKNESGELPNGVYGRTGASEEARHSIYDLPDRCSECDASINMEAVDWVGPMTARCPYCSNSMKVELRDL